MARGSRRTATRHAPTSARPSARSSAASRPHPGRIPAQVQNLVSISLVLGSAGGAATHHWPLVLLGPPTDGGNSSGGNAAAALLSPVGGALIFAGREFLHWRPCCLGRRESALILLAHYVPADFPEVARDRPEIVPRLALEIARWARGASCPPSVWRAPCRSAAR